jgi:RNA polymerase sigma factor (sigma-70 family)
LGFDPQRGRAFSTYAWPAIMRQVWQVVKNNARQEARSLVGLPSADSTSVDPATLTATVPWQPALQQLVRRLPERLQQVIVGYYGLDGQPPASYRRLGARLNLSHERVRQLHTEALVWLRQPAHSQALRSLLQRHTAADYEVAEALAQRWLQKRGGRHGR